MGNPFTIGSILDSTLGAAGRAAGRVVGNVARRSTFDDPLSLGSVAEKFAAVPPEAVTPPSQAAAPQVNRAAIRASDLRARPMMGMAESIDFGATGSAPRSQGTYVSPDQRSENRAVAARGAFQASPEWRGAGGGLRSAAQMETDLGAHNLIDAGAEQALAGIRREEAFRGDPMSLANAARRKTLEAEDLMSADSEPFIRSAQGGGRLRDFQGQRESGPGVPTYGEERTNRSAIAQALARQDPQKAAEGATTMGRGRLAEELSILQEQLRADVQGGKRSPEDAQAQWNQALQKAQSLAEILKGGFPKSDSLLGQ